VCVSNYQNSSKEITLKYILRGEEKEISYTVYEGLVDYLFNLPKGINYNLGEKHLDLILNLRILMKKNKENCCCLWL